MKVLRPESPTCTGYEFRGWFKTPKCDGEEYDFSEGTIVSEKSVNGTDNTVYAKWEPKKYSITYKDSGGASFSGTHIGIAPVEHTYGSDTDLNDASKSGMVFGGWYNTKNCAGERLMTLDGESYDSNITLYAKWGDFAYTVKGSINIGDVTNSSQSVISGSNSSAMKFTVPEGYRIASYTVNGAKSDLQGHLSTWTFVSMEVLKNTIVDVTAIKDTVTLALSVTGDGFVYGNGEYAYGKAVTVTAVASDGFVFSAWSDGGSASHTVVMERDMTLTAIFVIDDGNETTKFVLTLNAGAGGTVAGGGSYEEGEIATVSATPSEGYEFSSWSDGGQQTHNVTMNDDKTLNATFVKLKTHNLSLTASGHGTVAGGGEHIHGSVVKVSAVPDEGYEFVSWSDGGQQTHNVTMNDDKTLTAIFQLEVKRFALVLGSSSGGTVSGSGTYEAEVTTAVAAVPDEGYEFVSWSDGGARTHDVTMKKDLALTALFAKTVPTDQKDGKCRLLLSSGMGGTVAGGGYYAKGERVTISVSAFDGYVFSSWSDGGQQTHDIIIDRDTSIAANFKPKAEQVPTEINELPKDIRTICNDLKTTDFGLIYTIPERSVKGGNYNKTIPCEVFEYGYLDGKMICIRVVDDSGGLVYSWTMDGTRERTKTDTVPTDISVTGSFKASDVGAVDIEKVVKSEHGNVPAFYLSFSAHGVLPYGADIRYRVGEEYAGSVFSLYYYAGGVLEQQKCTATVDAEGYIIASIAHCSYYVFVNGGYPPESSATDESMPLSAVAVIVLAAIGAAAVLFYRRSLKTKR